VVSLVLMEEGLFSLSVSMERRNDYYDAIEQSTEVVTHMIDFIVKNQQEFMDWMVANEEL